MLADIALAVGTTGWSAVATTAACLYRRRLHTDPLTGIGNRTALYRLARRRHRGQVGLCLIDLDRFKALNDTHGHDYGNRVLAAVAARLDATTHRGEHALRLHGDEFAVWLGATRTAGHAEARSEAITNALAEPLWIDRHRLRAIGSVGLATGPAHTPVSELLARADAHMYQVKHHNRPTVLPTHSDRTRDQHAA